MMAKGAGTIIRHDDNCFSMTKQRIGCPIDQAQCCDLFLHIPRLAISLALGYDDDDNVNEQDKLDYLKPQHYLLLWLYLTLHLSVQ